MEWTDLEREELQKHVRSHLVKTPEKPIRHFPWNKRAARRAALRDGFGIVRGWKERSPCIYIDDEADKGST
jgi:hypothetical protein